MSASNTAVSAAILKAFFQDEAYWNGRYADEDTYEVDGKECHGFDAGAVPDDAPVRIVYGDVYHSDGTVEQQLSEAFSAWQLGQDDLVQVRVAPARKNELLTLLSQHGFEALAQ